MQGMKGGSLHQADHVGRGVHRRQLLMMRRQRMAELHCLFRLAARADGNRFGHEFISTTPPTTYSLLPTTWLPPATIELWPPKPSRVCVLRLRPPDICMWATCAPRC